MSDLNENIFGQPAYLVRVPDGYFRAGQEPTPYPNLAQRFSFSQAEFIAQEQRGRVVKSYQFVVTEADAIKFSQMKTPDDPPVQQPLDKDPQEDPPVAPARRRRSSS